MNAINKERMEVCPACAAVGSYCGGNTHVSCGCFEDGYAVPRETAFVSYNFYAPEEGVVACRIGINPRYNNPAQREKVLAIGGRKASTWGAWYYDRGPWLEGTTAVWLDTWGELEFYAPEEGAVVARFKPGSWYAGVGTKSEAFMELLMLRIRGMGAMHVELVE